MRFVTGLDEQDILSNLALTDDEKKVYVKLNKSREKVTKVYGLEALDFTNEIFWNPQRTTLKITNTTFSDVFDDSEVEDLIFRMQVIGGGYSSIAPSLEITTERTGKKFYLTGEDEFVEKNYEEEYGAKRKAIAALDELLEGKGIDALLYLTWNTVDKNNVIY